MMVYSRNIVYIYIYISNAPQSGDPATALPWRIRGDRKIFKNQLKIDQKINEHRSNIDQTSSKKPPKNRWKSGQDGSKRRSCWLLAAKRLQHAPKTPQDIPKKAFLEAWRPSWAEKGAQDGPKLAPKTEAKSVLGYPGGVLGASWRRHVADFMYFWCIFDACLKKYAF